MKKKIEKKSISVKVGDFIHAKEKQYKHINFDGVVTEVFGDLIQIYGVGSRENTGFHEFQKSEMLIVPLDKGRFKYLMNQELLEAKEGTIKAQIKLNEHQNHFNELEEIIARHCSIK